MMGRRPVGLCKYDGSKSCWDHNSSRRVWPQKPLPTGRDGRCMIWSSGLRYARRERSRLSRSIPEYHSKARYKDSDFIGFKLFASDATLEHLA